MVAEVIEGGVLCRARRDTLYTHEHGQPGRVRTPLLTDCCRPEATRNPPISPITRQNKKKTKSEREIREEKGVSLSISSIVRLPFLQQTLSKLWQRKQKTESPSREAFYFVTSVLRRGYAPSVVPTLRRIRPRGAVNADAAITTAEKENK